MRGDFSRITFDAHKHYSGVLMQQGRVQVDADWNELQAIEEYRDETTSQDVIGACGAPRDRAGFQISATGNQLQIGQGHFYVDGILCENDQDVTYNNQPDFLDPPSILNLLSQAETSFGLVYLDVWQRHLTALDDPHIREVALGGPDTATRLKTVWQVKVLPVSTNPDLPNQTASCDSQFPAWDELVASSTGRLNAFTATPKDDDNPCLLPPAAGYLRLENQLYRVEIHNGSNTGAVTFKWSRDNGSVTTAIQRISGNEITVADLGRDEVLGFNRGDWVEVVDDRIELNGQPGDLVQISDIKPGNILVVTPTPTALGSSDGIDPKRHSKLRRWNQSGATATATGVAVVPGTPIDLEGGIQIQFSDGTYRSGDYWLIPARTATGQIEWPPSGTELDQPPLGIQHHYCRLALIKLEDEILSVTDDCRPIFDNLVELSKRQGGGCCTVVVRPESLRNQSLQALLNGWKNKGPVTVCLMPGTYSLSQPLQLDAGHSDLTLEGCRKGVIFEVAQGAEKQFVQGMIVLVKANRVTLRRLQFNLPVVPFAASGGRLAGLDQKTMDRLSQRQGDGGVSIGVRPIECSDLTVEDCHFQFLPGLTEAGLRKLLAQQSFTGLFGVGIFAAGTTQGLTVGHNQFNVGAGGRLRPTPQLPFYFIGCAVTVAISLRSSRTNDVALARQSINGSVLIARLNDAAIHHNEFRGMVLATLIYGDTGTLSMTQNSVQECYSGFWVLSLQALAAGNRESLNTLTQEITAAQQELSQSASQMASGNAQLTQLILQIAASLLLDPSLFTTVNVALAYPLPATKTAATSVSTQRSATPTPLMRSIASRAATSFDATGMEAGNTASANADVFTSINQDQFTNQNSVGWVDAISDRLRAVLGAVVQTQPSLTLTLDVSHNQIDARITGVASGNTLLVWDLDQQTNSTVIVSNNTLTNNTLQPLPLPTGAIFLADRVTVTGNLVINEWKQQSRAQFYWSFLLIPGGTSPVSSTKETTPPTDPLIAVTGNVFRGIPLLPLRRSLPALLNNWWVFNTISL